ncbi:hypothetical protein [Aliarcobacter skirrowii]|nr:hypothetical protein [Aliarcobacter skirrowii]
MEILIIFIYVAFVLFLVKLFSEPLSDEDIDLIIIFTILNDSNDD